MCGFGPACIQRSHCPMKRHSSSRRREPMWNVQPHSGMLLAGLCARRGSSRGSPVNGRATLPRSRFLHISLPLPPRTRSTPFTPTSPTAQLYNCYALPLGLHEACLAIYRCAGHSDAALINQTWDAIIADGPPQAPQVRRAIAGPPFSPPHGRMSGQCY